MNPAGAYQINGKDFWTVFSLIVEKGKDDFLKPSSRKESITRDWSDSNGLDMDLSNKVFNARDISLRCAILADSEDDFWQKLNAFKAEFMLPGFTRLQVRELGFRSYYCVYKDHTSFDSFTRIKIDETNELKVACKFTINFTELEPTLENHDIFIVDELGRFLIT
jgi:hypothetical protein